MALTDKHAQNVCRIGQGERTCSFLANGANGWECLKGTSLEAHILSRRAKMVAKGDNCSGPPHFAMFDV
jgi:hypothetical protein